LSDELPGNLRAVADFFGLPGTAAVAKDFHVVRAIRALAEFDAAPFDLVFGGGTALARAHRIIRRMSEDVDFKIVSRPAAPVSRSALRRQLDALRPRVSAALQAAGFAFDPADKAITWARDEGHYAVWQLAYPSESRAGEGLRSTIKVELNYAPLRRAVVRLPVQSFAAEATRRPPEVPELACVSTMETAAEKLVSLTRRTAMEMAGVSRDRTPPSYAISMICT
jgi:predicted nucleotidyltransferase component of viral defense system